MKCSMPMLSLKAWGSIGEPAASFVHHVVGSGVFRRESSYTQLERYYTPFNPQTELQQEGAVYVCLCGGELAGSFPGREGILELLPGLPPAEASNEWL